MATFDFEAIHVVDPPSPFLGLITDGAQPKQEVALLACRVGIGPRGLEGAQLP